MSKIAYVALLSVVIGGLIAKIISLSIENNALQNDLANAQSQLLHYAKEKTLNFENYQNAKKEIYNENIPLLERFNNINSCFIK